MSTAVAAAVALGSLAALTVMGLALDLGLRLFPGIPAAARWPLRTMTAVAALYLATLSPAVVAGTGLAAWFSRTTRLPPATATPPQPLGWAGRVGAVVLAGWALAALARPLGPLYWDEFVWTTKAAIEARGGWGALKAAALVPGTEVFPSGYPLLWSLLPAWTVRRADPIALTTGFQASKLLVMATFVGTAVTRLAPDRRSLLLAMGVTVTAPLLFVHARSTYADLPVGLLAASLLLSLSPPSQGPAWPATAPVVLALVLVGFKDEGLAHVLAVTFAAAVASAVAHRPWATGATAVIRAALAAAFAGGAAFALWRLQLWEHGVADADHRLTAPAFGAVPAMFGLAIGEAVDLVTWGVLWPAVLAAVVWLAVRTRGMAADPREHAHLVLLALGGQVAILGAALICGPERVRAFALAGTVVNRLLVQLAPVATLVLAAALLPAARTGRSPAAADPDPPV